MDTYLFDARSDLKDSGILIPRSQPFVVENLSLSADKPRMGQVWDDLRLSPDVESTQLKESAPTNPIFNSAK